MNQLKLVKPVLVGHSIAGEELSSVGSRAPETVAGLIYLDAGYAYSFYDAATGDLTIDYDVLRREMEQFMALGPMKERKQRLSDIAQNLPRFEKDLVPYRERMASAPDNAPGPPDSEAVRVDIAISLESKGSAEFNALYWQSTRTHTLSGISSRIIPMP